MAIKTSRKIFKPLVFVASLGPIFWIVFALWSDSTLHTNYLGKDPTQNINRELGDWALIFIVITLAVRPIGQAFKPLRDLVAYRRMVGLFVFFYAFLHVLFYVIIDLEGLFNIASAGAAFIDDIIKRKFITIGIIALILLLPLAITSTKGMIRRMGGRQWQRLHMLIYFIAPLVVLHFYMMIRAGFSRPIIYGSLIAALLAYRYYVKWRKNQPRRPSGPAAAAAE
jgi:methionine sulfoxide reductase heme-binding subunit